MHPIKRICNAREITLTKFGQRYGEINGCRPLSIQQLSQYCSDRTRRSPSRKTMERMYNAFPELDVRELMFYHRRKTDATAERKVS